MAKDHESFKRTSIGDDNFNIGHERTVKSNRNRKISNDNLEISTNFDGKNGLSNGNLKNGINTTRPNDSMRKDSNYTQGIINNSFVTEDDYNEVFDQSELTVGSSLEDRDKRTSDINKNSEKDMIGSSTGDEDNTRRFSGHERTNINTNTDESPCNNDSENVQNNKLYHTADRTRPKSRHESLDVSVTGTNGISRSRSMSDSLRRTGHLQNDLC